MSKCRFVNYSTSRVPKLIWVRFAKLRHIRFRGQPRPLFDKRDFRLETRYTPEHFLTYSQYLFSHREFLSFRDRKLPSCLDTTRLVLPLLVNNGPSVTRHVSRTIQHSSMENARREKVFSVDPHQPLPVAGYFAIFPLYLALVSVENVGQRLATPRKKNSMGYQTMKQVFCRMQKEIFDTLEWSSYLGFELSMSYSSLWRVDLLSITPTLHL